MTMFAKKKNKKETLQRHRCGNFELRISEEKVEIEDIAHKLSKHVYNAGGFEYGMFAFLLSQTKQTPEGVLFKTTDEMKESIEQANFMVTMLAYTNLIFSNMDFRQKYYDLIGETIKVKTVDPVDEKEDRETIKELEKVDEMTELVKE